MADAHTVRHSLLARRKCFGNQFLLSKRKPEEKRQQHTLCVYGDGFLLFFSNVQRAPHSNWPIYLDAESPSLQFHICRRILNQHFSLLYLLAIELTWLEWNGWARERTILFRHAPRSSSRPIESFHLSTLSARNCTNWASDALESGLIWTKMFTARAHSFDPNDRNNQNDKKKTHTIQNPFIS